MTNLITLLERLPLRHKLILGFSVLSVLILVLGVQSLGTQESLKRDMQQLYQKDLVGVSHLHEARVQLPHMTQALQRAVGSSNAQNRIAALGQLHSAQERLQEALAQVNPTLRLQENLVRQAELEVLVERLKDQGEQALRLDGQGSLGQALALINSDEYQGLDQQADERLNQMAESKETLIHDTAMQLAQFAERSANSIGLEQETIVPMGAIDNLILGFDAGVASEVSQVDL